MLDDPKVSAKKIRSAVTDSGTRGPLRRGGASPGVSNLLTIYSALTGRSVEDLEEEYDGRGYGDLKGDLAEVVVEFVTPFRDRTLELLDDRAQLDAILTAGCRVGPTRSPSATLADVYDRVGFVRVVPSVTAHLGAASSRRSRVDDDDRGRHRRARALGGAAPGLPDRPSGTRRRRTASPRTSRSCRPTRWPRRAARGRAAPRRGVAETRAFTVHLRGTGTFRPVSPVVFVTVVEGI